MGAHLAAQLAPVLVGHIAVHAAPIRRYMARGAQVTEGRCGGANSGRRAGPGPLRLVVSCCALGPIRRPVRGKSKQPVAAATSPGPGAGAPCNKAAGTAAAATRLFP